MAEQTAALVQTPRTSLINKFGERYDIDQGKVLALVGATVFKGGKDDTPLTPEETVAALIVCNAFDLNPFTKEIYAFRSKGKLLVVVGVDGWARIVNRQEQLNGIEFEEHFDENGKIHAVTCKIHRKDCALPICITEYTHECKRESVPWNTMPIRMTRNRAFVQCARVAFSIAGIVDDDEAQTIEGAPGYIIDAGVKAVVDGATTRIGAVKAAVRHQAKNTGKQPPQQVEGEKEPSAVDPTSSTSSDPKPAQTKDSPQQQPSSTNTSNGPEPTESPVNQARPEVSEDW